jgi:Methyltransferase domain
MNEIEEYSNYLNEHIQGMFGPADMKVLKEEIEKLKPGQVYVEIGVDEGRSMAVAHHYAKEGVFVVGIDIHDVYIHSVSEGRGAFAEKEGIIGTNKKGFFVHGDADVFASLWNHPIDLLFIDGGHDYEEVKLNTLKWEGFVKKGGTILFHDIDYSPPGVKGWLDDHYKKWEPLHGKIGRVVV